MVDLMNNPMYETIEITKPTLSDVAKIGILFGETGEPDAPTEVKDAIVASMAENSPYAFLMARGEAGILSVIGVKHNQTETDYDVIHRFVDPYAPKNIGFQLLKRMDKSAPTEQHEPLVTKRRTSN